MISTQLINEAAQSTAKIQPTRTRAVRVLSLKSTMNDLLINSCEQNDADPLSVCAFSL